MITMAINSPTPRTRRKLSRQAWMALIFGLPLFILLAMFINGYQAVNGMIMAITPFGLFVTTMRRKNSGIRFTRIAFFSFLATFLTIGSLVENPALWPSQIYRHLFKESILQPSNPKIVEVNQAFNWWLDNWSVKIKPGEYDMLYFYGKNLTDITKPMEDSYFNYIWYYIKDLNLSFNHFYAPGYYKEFQKLVIIEFFIQNFIMTWTSDPTVYHVSDHVPVPDEALSRWSFSTEWKKDPGNDTFHGRDDCDGIAVVTVSFLRRLMTQGNISGQAYIACGYSHWFTAISINASTPFVFLNELGRDTHVYCIFMSNELPLYGQNVFATLLAGSIVDSAGHNEFLQYLDILMGPYFGIVIAAGILLGLLVALIFGYPRDYDINGEQKYVHDVMDKHRNAPKIARTFIWLFLAKIGNPFGRRHLYFWLNTALLAGLFIAGISILFAIASSTLFPYTTIFMLAYIFGMFFVLDRDYITRGFKRIYKKVKRTDFKLHR